MNIDFDAKIGELENRASKFITIDNKRSFGFKTLKNLSPDKQLYIASLVVIFVLLLYFKPKFIMSQPDLLGNYPAKIVWNKFLVFWLLLSFILCVGVYAKYHRSSK